MLQMSTNKHKGRRQIKDKTGYLNESEGINKIVLVFIIQQSKSSYLVHPKETCKLASNSLHQTPYMHFQRPHHCS